MKNVCQLPNTSTLCYEVLRRLVLILQSTAPVTIAQSSATVSITAYPEFSAQRQCVQGCIWGNNLKINTAIRCAEPILNGCFCRPDLQSVATSKLSDCVGSYCAKDGATPTYDLNVAISINSGYCEPALSPGITAAMMTTTTSSPTSDDASPPSTVIVTVGSSPTASSSSSNPSTKSEFPRAFLAVWTIWLSCGFSP